MLSFQFWFLIRSHTQTPAIHVMGWISTTIGRMLYRFGAAYNERKKIKLKSIHGETEESHSIGPVKHALIKCVCWNAICRAQFQIFTLKNCEFQYIYKYTCFEFGKHCDDFCLCRKWKKKWIECWRVCVSVWTESALHALIHTARVSGNTNTFRKSWSKQSGVMRLSRSRPVYQRSNGHKFTENVHLIAVLWLFIKFNQLIMGN